MAITKEESKKIKEHLLNQLENFPEDKRTQIESQVKSMSDEDIENFIEQNKLTHLGGQCIFCSIIANKTNSFKIASNDKNIAILELNPSSKGHTLVFPKEHLEEIPDSTKIFAKEISDKLQTKLNPDRIEINETNIMNHAILEVIPIFGEKTERRKATEEELKELQEEILKPKEANIQEKKIIKEKIPILAPKIP
jgi:histidine triad (HIT) family protein